MARAALRAMPRLLAEESVQMVQRIGVALSGDEGRRVYAQWLAIAHPNTPRADTYVVERAAAIRRAKLKVFDG